MGQFLHLFGQYILKDLKLQNFHSFREMNSKLSLTLKRTYLCYKGTRRSSQKNTICSNKTRTLSVNCLSASDATI